MVYFSIQYMYPRVIARRITIRGRNILRCSGPVHRLIWENMETRIVRLTKIPTEMHKVLKFENLAASGGEAKYMIAEGLVKLNGRVETQKQKKIHPGDVIEIEGCRLEIERDVIT